MPDEMTNQLRDYYLRINPLDSLGIIESYIDFASEALKDEQKENFKYYVGMIKAYIEELEVWTNII